MTTLIVKRYETILQQMISSLVARTGLNDITDSSGVKHLLSAPAREMDQIYYQLSGIPDLFSIDSAVGDDLDSRAKEMQPALISRNPATKSTGTVIFGRTVTASTTVVPAGTVVKTSGGVLFKTTGPVTFGIGEASSPEAFVVANDGGAAGNVAASSVSKFDSKPAGVDTVSNPSTMVGGSDVESDDSFRTRLKMFISTLARSTLEALEFAALSVRISNGKRVVFAHATEDIVTRGEVTLSIDDGSGTAEEVVVVTDEVITESLAGPPVDTCVGGEQFLRLNNKPVKVGAPFTLVSNKPAPDTVLVAGTDFILNTADAQLFFPVARVAAESLVASYTAHTGLIAAVQKVIDGDPEDRVNYPGWRAAGVRVTVNVPAILQQVIVGTVLVAEGYVKATVIAAVKEAISAYINNLGISGDVIRAEIIQRVMEVPGVINMSLSTPSADVILLDDQLPRVTLGNITLS